MNLIRSGGEPTKYSAGRVDNDWSPRHVRLRFEMVTVSIVFYFIGTYGGEVLNLPLITLPEEASGNLIKVLSFGLALFAIISFIARSQYERALWPKYELLRLKDINQFNAEYEEILEGTKGIGIPQDEFKDSLIRIMNMKDLLGEYAHRVSLFVLQVDDLHTESGVNSTVHPKFWSKVVRILNGVNRDGSRLLELSSGLKLENGEFSSQPYVLERVPFIYAEAEENLRKELGKLTPEVSDRIRELKYHSIVRRFQTTILSVWVPVFLAISLVLLGAFNLAGICK